MIEYNDLKWTKDNKLIHQNIEYCKLIEDKEFPKMYRIQYPNGDVSDMYSKVRAKDNAMKFYCFIINMVEDHILNRGGKPLEAR